MLNSFKVIRTVYRDNREFGAKVIAEFNDKSDAFYWVKYQDSKKNSKGRCRYYLRTIKSIYRVSDLPSKYKEFDVLDS